MMNQQTTLAKNVSSSRPKSGVSRQGVPRRPISASMSSKKARGAVQILETPKAQSENKPLLIGGTKVMNIHTEQARMHLKAPPFIATMTENNQIKANDLNRSMNTSQNTSYDYRSNEKSWRHNDWSQRNQSNVLNSTLQFIPLNNNSFVSQDLKAATVNNLPAVTNTSRGAYIPPQKVILSPSNSRDRTEHILNFQDYTPSQTPVPLKRDSVMREVIPGTLYDHLKTFLKKHTDNKSKKMSEKPLRSKEESKAKMSGVKLYYPQAPVQRTSRDSSSQVRKNEKMIIDQREEEIIKARMRDSLLKNLLDTIAKASKSDIQNTASNESEKVLIKERIPSLSNDEGDRHKRRGRFLLEQKTDNTNILTSQNNEEKERYPFVKSLHRDFRKKRAKENYNPTSRIVNTTFEETTPRLPSFYKPLKATANTPEPIIFVKRITEQMPPKKRYSIPIKDIPPVVETKATARMNLTTGRGRNQSLSSYRRFKESSMESQPSSRAPTSKRLRISDAVPFVRQSYGNRTLEKELKFQKEKNDEIEGWDADNNIFDAGRWNSPINFNNNSRDWSPAGR